MNLKEQIDFHEQAIIELKKHALTANEEMGVIKNDIKWIIEKLNSLDGKLWALILAILGLILKLFWK